MHFLEKELENWYSVNKRMPRVSDFGKDGLSAYSQYLTHFGGIRKATKFIKDEEDAKLRNFIIASLKNGDKVSYSVVNRLFIGGIEEAKTIAGLDKESVLVRTLQNFFQTHHRLPSVEDCGTEGLKSYSTYCRVFGSWKAAKKRVHG